MKFLMWVRLGQKKKWLHFRNDVDSIPDIKCPKCWELHSAFMSALQECFIAVASHRLTSCQFISDFISLFFILLLLL